MGDFEANNSDIGAINCGIKVCDRSDLSLLLAGIKACTSVFDTCAEA
jgi:hypothetical protein